jgi:hypothetical protein
MWELAFELHLSADKVVQCLGGFGYSILAPATKHLLDTQVASLCEGTDGTEELKIASTVLEGTAHEWAPSIKRASASLAPAQQAS